jgi:hypothetical protein
MAKKIWLPKSYRDAFNKPKNQKAYGLDVILVKQEQKPMRETRICETCGSEYRPRTPTQRFCKKSCNPKNRPHFCLNCGKELSHDRNAQRKFCSGDCFIFYRIKQYDLRNAKAKEA